ncbi:hypothetical protein chiPu_0003648 [Chiloscyllium punctatum]|uniref:Uncharacterized protein n=1 Tax=Chiloscyllium punctatum TaxID=137246 RepID=A0A401S4A3_CHIPU|nr:hypothetical protein [Chiloscyllium punctatum]
MERGGGAHAGVCAKRPAGAGIKQQEDEQQVILEEAGDDQNLGRERGKEERRELGAQGWREPRDRPQKSGRQLEVKFEWHYRDLQQILGRIAVFSCKHIVEMNTFMENTRGCTINVYTKTPDGGWGWIIAIAFFFIEVLTYGIMKSLGVFFYDLMAYFDVSNSRVSWILSISAFVMMFTAKQVSASAC